MPPRNSLSGVLGTAKLGEEKACTTYTDSRYEWGVVHDFGAIWSHRGYLTSAGTPILNTTHIKDLLDAILLSSQLAVVKCIAHTKDTDSKGNSHTELVTKAAASLTPPRKNQYLSSAPPLLTLISFEHVKALQSDTGGTENGNWSVTIVNYTEIM